MKFQSLSQQYLDKVGLLKTSSDYISTQFIQKQLDQFMDKVRPIQKIKNVMDMLNLCQPE